MKRGGLGGKASHPIKPEPLGGTNDEEASGRTRKAQAAERETQEGCPQGRCSHLTPKRKVHAIHARAHDAPSSEAQDVGSPPHERGPHGRNRRPSAVRAPLRDIPSPHPALRLPADLDSEISRRRCGRWVDRRHGKSWPCSHWRKERDDRGPPPRARQLVLLQAAGDLGWTVRLSSRS